MALCQAATANKKTFGSAEKQSPKPIQQAKPTKPKMFKQPEPVKPSEDEELESDEDEGETEGGEEDVDDSDNDDEQAEEGVENDNEEDDQDENDQEDEDNQQDDGEQEDKDEDDDDDDDDDDDEEVEDKREPPSKEVKGLGDQQRMAKGAQQPVKEVKEKIGKANNVSSSSTRASWSTSLILCRLLQDAAKQGQQTADIVAKQARQESLGDLAGVSSDGMTAAPDQPSQTGDKAHEAKKDAKNAASGTTEQAEKTSKTSEGKKEGQDGDPFSGLEMTTHFPKSTSANDVWVNVTSTAERTSVTIRIPGR